MPGNTTILKIAIEVDDKGTRHVRTFGQEAEKAADKGEKGFKRTGKSLDTMNAKLQKSHGWILKVGGAMLTYFGARKLINSMEEWVRLSGKQEQATAGMEQAMRSMGRYTPELYNQLIKTAQGLQQVTTFGDEATIAGQKFLLTYKDISNDMLPRASKAMLDLAALMGGDTTQAANMLGKASMGMTGELRRVGITVSKTAYEAKGFVGVLEEIEQQVGGQARALAGTGYGGLQQLGNLYGDLKEKWGKLITDIGQAGVFDIIGEKIEALSSKTEEFSDWVPEHKEEIINFFNTLETAITGVGKAAVVLGKTVGWTTQFASDVGAALGLLEAGVLDLEDVFTAIFDPNASIHTVLKQYENEWQIRAKQIRNNMDAVIDKIDDLKEKRHELYEQREEILISRQYTQEYQKAFEAETNAIERQIRALKEEYENVQKQLDETNLEAKLYAAAEAAGDIVSEIRKIAPEVEDAGKAIDDNLRGTLEKFAAGFVAEVRDTRIQEQEEWLAYLNEHVDAFTKYMDEKEQEELKREAEKNEKILRDYEHTLERMHDATADFIFDLMDGQIRSWEDMFDRILVLFKRLLADMIAQAILKPIVVPIVTSITDEFGLTSATGATEGLTTTATGGLAYQLSSAAGYGLISGGLAQQFDLFGGSKENVIGAGIGGAIGGIGIETPYFAMWGPIGMAIGAIIGGLISELFEKGPPSMDLSHMAQYFSSAWTPGMGLAPATGGYTPGIGANDAAIAAVSDAYKQARNTLTDAFNEQIFSLIEMMPQYADDIEAALSSMSFSYKDTKRFEIQWAEEYLEEAMTGYADFLTGKMQEVYNAIVPMYVSGEITGSAYYNKLAPRMQQAYQDILAGGYKNEDLINLLSSFEQGAAAYEKLIFQMESAAGLLSDLEIAQFGVNQQFDNWIATLRALGISEEEIARAEELRAMALAELALKYEDLGQAMESITQGVDIEALAATFENIQFQILSMTGQLTDMEIEAYRINQQFDDWIDTLTKLGATQEQLTWIEQQRVEALGQLTDAVLVDVEGIRQEYLRLTTSAANPADIYERMAILEGQLAPIGSALTEADLALYREYLTLAQQAYQRPSMQYQNIYQQVTAAYEAWLAQHQSYQHGTDYLPRTGPIYAHQGERITPAGQNIRHGDVSITLSPTFHIDGAKDPRDTAREMENGLTRWVRGPGRAAIREVVRYQ